MQKQGKGIRFFERIRKDFQWIVFITLLTIVITSIYTFFLVTPIYEASTEVWVSNPMSESRETTEMKDSYSVIATSDLVLDPVIKNLDLDTTSSSLRTQIEVENIGESEVLSIKVRDKNPYAAAEIANSLTQTFEDTMRDVVEAIKIQGLSEATASTSPVYPNNIQNIMISGVVGLLISLVVVIVRELSDHSVKTHEAVEEMTGFRRIGKISKFTEEDLLILGVRPKREKVEESEEDLLSRMGRRRI